MGSVGQERKEFVCDCRWKIFGSLVLQDRYDLRFLEFKGICLELEWKITTMSLISFRWFELTASGGVEIWYHLATTLCRWVLHGFVYCDFRQQWCPWWEVTVVLPAIGVLETFAHQDGANGKISSPMVWWRQWFAFNRRFGSFGKICSWPLSKWEDFITIDLVTSTFRNAFIEIQAGTMHVQELELCVGWNEERRLSSSLFSRRKFDDLRHHWWHLFENFAMKVVEF